MPLTLDESRDLWLSGGEITPEGKEAVGVTSLLQRIERSLNTKRGAIPYYPTRGFCVADYVMSKAPLWVIRGGIERECKADEQVSDASATVVRNPDGSLSGRVAVVSSLGVFTFTMSATEAAGTLIQLEAQL